VDCPTAFYENKVHINIVILAQPSIRAFYHTKNISDNNRIWESMLNTLPFLFIWEDT